MSVSTFLRMLAYYKKYMVGSAYSRERIISYEPTCSHKQCDRIGAITTVPTLYIPLYKGLYTLGVNMLTKSSHLATKYP